MADDVCYTLTATAPAPEEAVPLYRAAEWWGSENDFASMKTMLDHSFAVVCARDREGKLVGMMRALADGVSDAYMLDLVVAPEFRRRGIGRAIADFLAAHLEKSGIEWIVCIGVPGTENLYGQCHAAQEMRQHTPWRFRAHEASTC